MATTPLPHKRIPADAVSARPPDLEVVWRPAPSASRIRLPLRLKIILPFLLLTALLALAGSLIATRLVTGSLEERAASHLSDASAAIGASLQRIGSEQLSTLRTVIHTQGVTEAMANRDLARLGQLLAPIQLDDEVDAVEVLAPDGCELTGLHREPNQSTGSSFRATVGRDLSGWSIVQNVFTGASPDRADKPVQLMETQDGYILYSGSSVWQGDRLVGAALVGRSWEGILRELSLGTLAQIVVWDVQARVIGSTLVTATPAELPPAGGSDPGSPAVASEPIAWEWGEEEYRLAYTPLEVRSQSIATAALILPQSGIGLTGALDQGGLIALFALASFFVMGTGYLLANRITAPVQVMLQAFQRLSGGDFNPRLDTERRDEFGLLAEAFNTMAQDLEQRTERLRRKILQLGMMYDTSQELSQSLSLERVLEVVADAFHSSADWSFTAILLRQPGTSGYRLHGLRPRDLQITEGIPPEGILQAEDRLDDAISAGRPSVLGPADAQALLRSIGLGRHEGPAMAIPLRSGDPLGVVLAGLDREDHLPSEDRIRLIVTLAGEASRAIHSARLYRQVSRQVSELVMLQEASRGLASKLTHEEVLSQTAEELHAIVPDGAAVISLKEPSSGSLERVLTRGTPDRDWPGRGVAEAVVMDGVPRWFDPENPSPSDGRPGRALCVPLQVEGEPVGAIDITFPEEIQASGGDDPLLLLTTIANQAAVALKNARLHEEIQGLYLSIVQSLAAAIDARDPHTHGHSQRVVQTALKVAREMDLPQEDLPVLEVAAYLHDIGKLGVPDDILLKPGTLSDSERRIIDGHPDLGARILDPVGFDPRVLSCIVQHHERYDGTGYPRGRQGGEIALGARILGAVDAFDAMLSERPYRAPLTLEATLEELRSCAGSQFDPSVVEAILSLVERSELPVVVVPTPAKG